MCPDSATVAFDTAFAVASFARDTTTGKKEAPLGSGPVVAHATEPGATSAGAVGCSGEAERKPTRSPNR